MQKSTEELTRCSTMTLAEEVVGDIDNKATIQTVRENIMGVCKKITRWVVLVDLLLLILMIIVVVVLEFGVIPYKQMGFFCNDPKISFKYTGDTISIGFLLSFIIFAPLITIWIVEHACHSADSYKNNLDYSGSRSKYIWTWYGHFIVVFLILCIICECIKILVGEPRPHFLDTCRPREAVNCTDEYFVSYTCTNIVNSAYFVMDASRSFPSGHATMSAFLSVFLIWYLQKRLFTRMFFLKPWLQCLVCIWTVVCSVTRIGDKRHHWWDVIAGVVLGFLFGMFLVITVCRYFRVEYTNIVDVKKVANDTVEENRQINFVEK